MPARNILLRTQRMHSARAFLAVSHAHAAGLCFSAIGPGYFLRHPHRGWAPGAVLGLEEIAMSAAANERRLVRTKANHLPLTPLRFLNRCAEVYPRRTALIHGPLRQSWALTRDRCYRLASALVRRGVKRGETISIIAPNTPAMLEAHFGVPLSGATLNTIDHQLDAAAIASILRHGGCKLLMVDREFAPLVDKAIAMLAIAPYVIDINDLLAPDMVGIGDLDYESLLSTGDPDFGGLLPNDEWEPIALNYSTGATGELKGEVLSHRGTYLMSILQLTDWAVPRQPVYLWTLPMSDENGWGFPWAITAATGTHVCLRSADPRVVLDAIREHTVSHLCAPPMLLGMLAASLSDDKKARSVPVQVLTAGPPQPAAIEALEEAGFEIEHVFRSAQRSGGLP